MGWHLHTLPWLSLSPRKTSRQNKIVSTFQRIWREKREKEWEEKDKKERKRKGKRKGEQLRGWLHFLQST